MFRFLLQFRTAVKTLTLISAGILLCSLPAVTLAAEPVCDDFTLSQVEPALVEHMRTAAGRGMLYRIQPELSKISFEIDSPIGLVQADFKHFQGGFTLESGASGTEGKALLSAKTDSVDTASGFIRTLLVSETFLDTERYPQLLFVSRDFYWVNAREAVLIGDLSLHGVTRRIGLHVQLLENNPLDAPGTDRILVEASARIQRSAFGMNALASYVDDKVTLYMKIHARKYQPAIVSAQTQADGNSADDSDLFWPAPPAPVASGIPQI